MASTQPTPDIEKDLAELRVLEEQASRSRVKDLLKLEMRRLQTELTKRQQPAQEGQAPAGAPQGSASGASSASSAASASAAAKPARYKQLVKTYAWDQSDKFLKLYVTLKGVQSLTKEAITSQFTNHSVRLEVTFADKDCELHISQLAEHIDPSGSYHKVKEDMVLLMLKKQAPNKTWSHVTQQEKKAQEVKKPPAMEKDADPQASLMGMLKNMYEEGDDEMKRMLDKAFYESQTKKAADRQADSMGL